MVVHSLGERKPGALSAGADQPGPGLLGVHWPAPLGRRAVLPIYLEGTGGRYLTLVDASASKPPGSKPGGLLKVDVTAPACPAVRTSRSGSHLGPVACS